MPDESKGLAGLGEIAAKLDGAGMQWAVFAGAAASVYGADRVVTDVDILVPAAEGDRLMALFPDAELVSSQPGLLHLAMPGIDLLAGLGEVDLDSRMAARVTRHEIGGILVPVIPPEDNILLKATWGRGARGGKARLGGRGGDDGHCAVARLGVPALAGGHAGPAGAGAGDHGAAGRAVAPAARRGRGGTR